MLVVCTVDSTATELFAEIVRLGGNCTRSSETSKMTSLTKFLTLLCVLFSTAGNGLLAFKTNTGKQIVRKEGLCDGDYDNEYRLPGNVKPTHYDLTLRPDLEQFTFDGEASIRVNIQGDSVRQITIHQLDLSIHQASFITQDKGNPLDIFK